MGEKDCRWAESCDCGTINKHGCEKCVWYSFVDSGYGFCKAEPIHVLVPWCRDTCSHFSELHQLKLVGLVSDLTSP